jgi:hypothetical protein
VPFTVPDTMDIQTDGMTLKVFSFSDKEARREREREIN